MTEHEDLPSNPTGLELLAAVQAADNHFVIPDPGRAFRAACRRAVHDILNGDLVPAGFCLRYTGRARGDLVLTIVATEDEPRRVDPLPSIPVPESLRGCHPILRETREAIGNLKSGWIDTYGQKGVAHLRIHPGGVKRSLLILHAMVTESQRRGFDVKTVDVSPGPRDLHVGLVDEPVTTHAMAAWPGRVDGQRREPLDPSVEGHVVDLDASLSE